MWFVFDNMHWLLAKNMLCVVCLCLWCVVVCVCCGIDWVDVTDCVGGLTVLCVCVVDWFGVLVGTPMCCTLWCVCVWDLFGDVVVTVDVVWLCVLC